MNEVDVVVFMFTNIPFIELFGSCEQRNGLNSLQSIPAIRHLARQTIQRTQTVV